MKYRARMARRVFRESKRVWVYFDGNKWRQICANAGLISDYDVGVVDILKSVLRKY